MNGNAEFFKRNLSHGKTDCLWNWGRTNIQGKITEMTNLLGPFWMDLAFSNIYSTQTHNLITIL